MTAAHGPAADRTIVHAPGRVPIETELIDAIDRISERIDAVRPKSAALDAKAYAAKRAARARDTPAARRTADVDAVKQLIGHDAMRPRPR
jgi:hypothetical protein